MVFGFFRAISGDLREAHFVRSPGLRLSSGPDDPYGGEAILGRRKELVSGMMKDRSLERTGKRECKACSTLRVILSNRTHSGCCYTPLTL